MEFHERLKTPFNIYKYQHWFWRYLRTFTQKFPNIDFFLKILLMKDDELVMSET